MTPFLCIACGDTGGADLLSNIALFLPLGLSLAALGVGVLPAGAIGLGLSGLVEGMQFALIAGRDASLGDLIANTLGTVLGAALVTSSAHWLRPSPRAARRLAVAWAALAGAVLVFSRWALQPDLPTGAWYGQWANDGPEPDFFSGHVVEVRLAGLVIPHWRLPDSLKARLLERSADTVAVEATIVAGLGEPDARRILSLAGDDFRFLSVGADRGGLSCWVHTRAARLGLLSPRFSLAGGINAAPGATLAIGCRYADGRAKVWSRGTTERAAEARIGLLDPWLFFWPGPVPSGSLLWLLRAGTLTALLSPLLLWGARTRPRQTAP